MNTKFIDFSPIEHPRAFLPLALALAALALVSVCQLPRLPVMLTIGRIIEVR